MIKYVSKKHKRLKLEIVRPALLCLIALFYFTYPVYAAQNVYDNKYAAFIGDANTGQIYFSYNPDKKLHPASLTKMMTLLMVFDAIDRGRLRLNDDIPISSYAASMIPSKLGLSPGSKIKVKDAIYALVTKSANDIAVAVGEKIGGSEKNFAKMMTQKARAIGMRHTEFRNASGLHDSAQVSTARDMAKLARSLLTTYHRHYHYFSTKSFKYKGNTYRSHNRLMDSYAGMDGLKTGYIIPSGFNLVSSAKRGNTRLIGVVFGGKTAKSRNAHMEKLLNLAFARAGEGGMKIANVPIPPRKPSIPGNETLIIAANDNIPTPPSPEAGTASTETILLSGSESNDLDSEKINWQRWAMLDALSENSLLNRISGEGDYDYALRKRIETGLIAVSAHLNEKIPAHVYEKKSTTTVALAPKTQEQPKNIKLNYSDDRSWSIQVGAYSNRKSTDNAIAQSIKKLPAEFRSGHTSVAPTKTKEGWIFRARLHGYTKAAALKACQILKDCVPIPPSDH